MHKQSEDLLWDLGELSRRCYLRPVEILKLHNEGKGPRCIQVGRKRFLYRPEWVIDWIEKTGQGGEQ